MKKKILLFQTSIGKGGATRSNLKIIELLKERGIDIALVTGAYPKDNEYPALQKIMHYDLGFGSRFRAIFPLIVFLKKYKPDIVIGGMLQCNIILLSAKLIGFFKFKTIIIDRVNPSQEIGCRKGFFYRCFPYIIKSLYPRANALVSVSHGTRDDVLSIAPNLSNIRVIYNPSVTKDKLVMSYQDISHPWVNVDIPLIVSVGRLVKQKDFATLIRSISLVIKKTPVRLLILGEGAERESLLRLINDLGLESHVSLLGHVSNPHPFLRRCQLCVLSSAWEGFGNVLVEAMSYGTSVVSTDCPSGPSEILNNGEFGMLVPVGDCNLLSEAILHTLENPQDHNRLIERAKVFNEDVSLAQYIELIDQLSEGG